MLQRELPAPSETGHRILETPACSLRMALTSLACRSPLSQALSVGGSGGGGGKISSTTGPPCWKGEKRKETDTWH